MARGVTRRRIGAAALILPIIGLGLVARFLGSGLLADLSGGILYAILIYVLLVFLRPAGSILSNVSIALGFCVAVELLQITSLPATLGAAFPPIRLLLGSTFVALDLLAYLLGVLLALGADHLIRLLRRTPATLTG
ncbi:hypothetical protein CQ018_08050 [Arthrobacter sp. MYb227]|uniref:ribosomal maturation YjgA family protein n=1 Tax=Arthrobacter sp. MYb227 TaxID=1848601 RepID=UPI000CFCC4A5|nr:DUF2809 domain-containing protein [Arthrobacter sp. MYb227]PQZ93609.1 hypothetical protein CQ018_08050 [Arthrobacter sp. MYb227]